MKKSVLGIDARMGRDPSVDDSELEGYQEQGRAKEASRE